ncbi:chemotaxis response regulator protein-glutamate methylesterase [Tepidanaerobacter sp. GT38]|uniref:protein-glutamate methylesterase/protein-glutamine glutaminase n=1 Tax=Tepidanaerobacter sp. GT38 TaxID=2722793 RepID=UPI001F25BE90|nr:chemotaxis response regulator protein-glutamate methylesterase [Tepidanaerobacter sp. GT38]MCG1012191.1 chemotaxis response regulator protein-glutamate methylesterase [Tepidanaerobacter sp. GT38]
MSEKIRVLVVDDSAFMRRYISDIINKEPDMVVIDSAGDGDTAVKKILSLNPDVVTLDVEMPVKNGLEVLMEIKSVSNAKIIMLSGLTTEGSATTVEALSIGAFDFVEKPSGASLNRIVDMKKDLLTKIRHAYNVKIKKAVKRYFKIEQPTENTLKKARGEIEAVVLGASTGGPKVLYDVITNLPQDMDVPIFVVQHMPPGFTKAFAERLDKQANLRVVEAQHEEPIKPGVVYIAPGGFHMIIDQNKILLDTSPPVHGVRPAVDKLFISAAKNYEEKTLGCVFTGMGRDGAEGVKAIKAKGGFTIAQDESTSIIYGMPKAAYETGCVDLVLPDYQILEEIIRLVKPNKQN